ncbi:hypothetical protein HELRODRAFT_73589 [Helobdella robusta]|uniref:RRM domain-containing protein n=1 Tax=Helobdella robusta TaxID=6412 RepID=T1G1G2_HELRO|nr:hypothetical protein HELRODRAFT_73589 [Helobdella robusta]ESO09476.1 hypothetical protein HELRODRAFT_73589 [Helobdella robusta]
MSVKLFVGHVTPGSQKEVLEEMFSQYGVVIECSVMNNYAFVHMSTQEEADAAIADLNGFTFNGQQLSVEVLFSYRTGLTKIFIGNIKAGTTDDELRSLFETYGDVAEADVCGGFGFVHMKNQGDALKAIKLLKGYLLNGNRLNIEV